MMRSGVKYRSPRRPANRGLEFEHGDEIVWARLKDLSRYGARVDGNFNFAGPDRLALCYQGQKYPAEIVWLRFGSIGLRFDEPLDKRIYAALLGVSSRKAKDASGQKKPRYLAG